MTYKTEIDWYFGYNSEIKESFTDLVGRFVKDARFTKEDIEDYEDPDDALLNYDWGIRLAEYAEKREEDIKTFCTAVCFPLFHGATYQGELSQLVYLYIRDML